MCYEFETEIRNGMIKVPDDFKGKRTGRFKIIIIPEEKKHDKVRQTLLNAPVWSEEDIRDFNDNILKGYKNWIPEEL